MTISEYKKLLKTPLRPRTITFLLRNNEILLGLKKKGFGKGYLMGIGGKIENEETVEAGAIRELTEEIHIAPMNLQKVGVINFYFPHSTDGSWDQQVHVFITKTWEGKPQESEEIKPEWFGKEHVPYESMWDDAKYWLPQILAGQRINGEFIFNEELKVMDYNIKSL